MLRIDTRQIKPGMKLALPVQNPRAPAKLLLNVGYEITPDIIERLLELGIRAVWVRYPSLDFLHRYLDADGQASQSRVLGQIANTFQTLQTKSTARLPYDSYVKSMRQLVDHLATHPQMAVYLGDLADSNDDLMRHSSTVTYLSLLMGMKLEGYLVRERKHTQPNRAKEVTNLGLGAMLHDVGVTQLAPDVRRHWLEAGDETDGPWREHPAIGFEMVRARIDATAATIVLNHHQRFDGSGYAGGDYPVLSGKSVHIFARIAAVADQFDRLRNPPNLPPQPTVFVLGAMLRDLSDKFDPQVLKALISVVPPYPPGSIVRLSDGRCAVCIDHRPNAPCRPSVQIIPEPDRLDVNALPPGESIDLSEVSAALRIVEADHQPVDELNFAAPQFAADLTAAGTWL